MVKKMSLNSIFKLNGWQAYRTIRLFAYFSLFLSLAGCGGGGGGAGSEEGAVDTGTAKISLNWTAPEENVDGTELNDLAGFKVYYGDTSPVSKENSQSIDVGDRTDYTFDGLDPGTYYFAVTAYDVSGNESEFSEEVNKEISEG